MRREAEESAWLEELPGRLSALIDLVCFPGAGAGASVFRPWRAGLPAFTAILACQLPGRESRLDESPAESLTQAAAAVAREYLRRRPRVRPVALFGHSMGGTLAVETARNLAEMGRTPAALFISASGPPGPAKHEAIGRGELEHLLLAYDPANEAVIGDPELSVSLVPVLEADIHLLRSHDTRRAMPLDVPVWLFHGRDDPVVPASAVARWRRHFTGEVSTMEMPGGHQFPFRESRDALLRSLAPILRQAAGRPGG